MRKVLSQERHSIFVLSLIIFLVIVLRWKFLSMPLERDEGEYATMGQMLLSGNAPYSEAANMKLPGTYICYAVMLKVFGHSLEGLRIGILLLNCFSIAAFFVVARIIFSPTSALFSVVVFALWSQSPSMLAMLGHATVFVNFFCVLGLLSLLMSERSGKIIYYISSSFFFGLAFLCKQQSVFLLVWSLVYLLILCKKQEKMRNLLYLFLPLVSSMSPLFLIVAYLFYAGAFFDFWYWTFTYASNYVALVPITLAPYYFISTIQHFGPEAALWLLTLPLVIILLRWKSQKLLVSLLVASFLTVCPGYYFRPHYFIPLIIPLSLVVGAAINTVQARDTNIAIRMTVLAALMITVILHVPLWNSSPAKLTRVLYKENPFVEARLVSDIINQTRGGRGRIAVVGSEPEIYFYTNRLPATQFLYTYPLFENHALAGAMQEDMIRQVTNYSPEWIVWVSFDVSLGTNDISSSKIYSWFKQYRENYQLQGIVVPYGVNARYIKASKIQGMLPKENISLWKKRQ